MSESLMERTLRLLREHPDSVPSIYAALKAQGSEISFGWLNKFSSGDIKDPSVNKVEELYQFLTGESVLVETD